MKSEKWGDSLFCIYQFALLGDAGHLKSLLFEEGSDFGGLVALKFDAALTDGAAAAAGVAEFSAQLLDGGEADVRREVVNDDDYFASAMSGFASQHHAAGFWFAGGWRAGGGGGRVGAGRQAVVLQAGERIVQLRRIAGDEPRLIFSGHGKNVAAARNDL